MNKVLENRNLNTVLLLLYSFLFSCLLFGKEEGIQDITIILISIFSFLFFITLYSCSLFLYKFFIFLSVVIFIPLYIANEFVGGLNNAHFTAFFLTDFKESSSYIKVIPLTIVIKTICISFLFFYFLKASLVKLNSKIIILIILFIFSYSIFKYYRNAENLKKDSLYTFKTIYVAPIRIMVRSFIMFSKVKQEIEHQQKLQKIPNSWNVVKSENEVDITIIIVGESVRKDFFGIYNPSMSIYTPFLNNIPKIQFNNAISFGFQTVESLSASFMVQDDNHKPYFPNNIVSLTQKAGYDVSWISNQGSIGVEDNFIAAMGKQSNYYNFISKGRWNDHVSDDKMIDVLKNRLTIDNTNKKVYFMHMIGSHPDPCDITNGEFRNYFQSKNLSCYTESIRRTDEFIENVYNLLEKTSKSFNIVYFSDHGLYLDNSELVYHKNGYKESYNVPLIVINSSLKENVYHNSYRNLKDFMWFYQELLSIKTVNYNRPYTFFSEEIDDKFHLLHEGFNYNELVDNPK